MKKDSVSVKIDLSKVNSIVKLLEIVRYKFIENDESLLAELTTISFF